MSAIIRSCIVALCVGVGAPCVADQPTEQIPRWIAQLGSNQFQVRKQASRSLIEAGPSAIPAVSKAVLSNDREVQLRAFGVLAALFESKLDATHNAAFEALLRIARSKNPVAAPRALSLLQPPKELLAWIKAMDGEVTVDKAKLHKPVTELRLDRTRRIDPGFTPDRLRDEDLSRLKPLRHLRSLTLEYRTAMTDAGMKHLAHLRNLQTLNLSRTRITGGELGQLRKLRRLRTLNLARCPRLKDLGVKRLEQLIQLRSLILDADSNSGRSDEGWTYHLRALRGRFAGRYMREQLNELRGGITDSGMANIGKLRGLTSLSLVKTRITDAGLKNLANLKQLESLNLSRTAVTDTGLQNLAQLTKLKSLKLDFTPISNAGFKELKTLRNLEELRLRGTIIGDAGLAELDGLKRIHTLDLYGTGVSDASIEVLKNFPELKSLDVGRTRISFRGLVRLAETCRHFDFEKALRASGLVRFDKEGGIVGLDFGRTKVEDDDLKRLVSLPRLAHLTLAGPRITDRGLAHLSGLIKMQSLWLGNTSVTDRGLIHLKRMSSLRSLGIRETRVTLGGIRRLVVELQGRPLADAVSIAGYRQRDDEYPELHLRHPDSPLAGVNRAAKVAPEKQLRPSKSGRGLMFVNLKGAAVTDGELANLADLENVGALFLNGNSISDRGLKHLARLKQLEVLWVSGKAITVNGLVKLKPLVNLHTLWVTDTTLTDRDLIPLRAALPKLRILNLSGTAITDAAVDHLRRFTGLGVLIIDSLALSDAALKRLRKARPGLFIQISQKRALAAVRGGARNGKRRITGHDGVLKMGSVYTEWPNIGMVSIFGIAHFERALRMELQAMCPHPQRWKELSTLEDVSIVTADVPDDAIAALVHLPRLKTVSFYRAKFKDESLAHLAGCKAESLDLQRTTITDAALVHLKRLPNLKILSLGGYGTAIKNAGFKHLAEVTTLEVLQLNRTSISDEALKHLKSLKRLKKLELREVKVDKGLRHIGTLPNLVSLDLSSTNVSDATLPHLYGLSKLASLSLRNTFVTPEGIQRLRKRMPSVRVTPAGSITSKSSKTAAPLQRLRARIEWDRRGRVSRVDLQYVKNPGDAIIHVVKLPSLRSLTLGPRATDKHLKQLRPLKQLDTLDIKKSAVTGPGLEHLKGLHALRSLRLGRTAVSDQGLAFLQPLKELRFIDLGYTKVTDRGGKHLGAMAKLYQLSLRRTAFGDEGLSQLARSKSIHYLTLDGTRITDAGLKHLKNMKSLGDLDLRNTRVSQAAVAELQKALPECLIRWSGGTKKAK